MQKTLTKLTYSVLSVFIISGLFNDSNVKAQSKSHITQEIGHGLIDWTDKVIKVTGNGAAPADKPIGQARLLAERAAIVDAYRQLSEIVYGVRVDSQTTVKDCTVQSDIIKTNVEGFIKGARRGEKRFTNDGNVEYDLYVSIFGQSGLADVIDLDKYIKKKQKTSYKLNKFHNKVAFNFQFTDIDINKNFFKIANSPDNQNNNCLECHTPHPITSDMKKKNDVVESLPSQPIEQNNQNSPITGVIIDAKGLGLTPSMDPAIYDPDITRVYIGDWEIDADFVINNGVIGYFSDLEEAKKDIKRVGKNPIVIKANSVRSLTDLLLEKEAANILNASDNQNKFLEKYAVNVVM